MKSNYTFIIIAIILAILYFGFTFFVKTRQNLNIKTVIKESMMKISSSSFDQGKEIPSKYTCGGQNINPEISISEVPQNALSLALIVEDPDSPSGTFTHWVVFNIDPSTKEIPENAVIKGAVLGKNDFGSLGYGGPCPGSGTHRYYFKVFALDEVLNIPQGSNRSDINNAMEGHIIDEAQIMGTYSRKL